MSRKRRTAQQAARRARLAPTNAIDSPLPDPKPELPWTTDDRLLQRAIQFGCEMHRAPTLRWCVMAEMFAINVQQATEMCERFGLDPDERIVGWEG